MDKIINVNHIENDLCRVTIQPENGGKPYTAHLSKKEVELRKLKENFTERLSGIQIDAFDKICELEREIVADRKDEDFAERCGECER